MIFNLPFKHSIIISLFKKDRIIGVGSKVFKDEHILYLDLDNTSLKKSEDIVRSIQKNHVLGTAIILKSSEDNYHAIFFDVIPFNEMISIQKSVNLKHGCISEMKGESTIRLSSKFGVFIKPIKIIQNNDSYNAVSKGHFNIFIQHFSLDKRMFDYDSLLFADNSDNISLYCYDKRLRIL